jgi:hypothetical protein
MGPVEITLRHEPPEWQKPEMQATSVRATHRLRASPSTTSCSARDPANAATTARAAADSSCFPAAKSSSIPVSGAAKRARISAASSTWRGARNGAGSSGTRARRPPSSRRFTGRPGAESGGRFSTRARFASRSRVRMQSACACASASIAEARSMRLAVQHFLGHAQAEARPSASSRGACARAAGAASGTTSW